jgi:hypothetical protein
VQIIQPPRVEQRPEKAYVGIRVVTPFRGMLRARDELLAELYKWLTSHDFEPAGPFFLRLHVIDMEGPMDLEVGVVTTRERIRHAYLRRSRPACQQGSHRLGPRERGCFRSLG